MLFYRSANAPKFVPMHVRRVRSLSLIALSAYPAGGVLLLLAGETGMMVSVLGYGLMLAALIAFAGIVSTGVQRITSENKALLDPLELELRQKAYSMAYHLFASGVIIAAFYAQIAIDSNEKLGLWLPASSDHWSAVMWGAIITLLVLPSACLAWSMPLDVEDEAET